MLNDYSVSRRLGEKWIVLPLCGEKRVLLNKVHNFFLPVLDILKRKEGKLPKCSHLYSIKG